MEEDLFGQSHINKIAQITDTIPPPQTQRVSGERLPKSPIFQITPFKPIRQLPVYKIIRAGEIEEEKKREEERKRKKLDSEQIPPIERIEVTNYTCLEELLRNHLSRLQPYLMYNNPNNFHIDSFQQAFDSLFMPPRTRS